MNAMVDLPGWVALPVAILVLVGAGLTLLGALGLVRLGSFYQRIHAPTLGTTLGTGAILLASMICFSVLQSRLVVHEILIALFMSVTTPVTLMLVVRAALARDIQEGSPEVAKLRREGHWGAEAVDGRR
ncbi:MAG: monovalent cation/H(+) antiporter subunit G [Pseudorhodoplanes sp.]